MTKRTYFPASASDSRLYNEKVVSSLSRPDCALIPAYTSKKLLFRLDVEKLIKEDVRYGGFEDGTALLKHGNHRGVVGGLLALALVAVDLRLHARLRERRGRKDVIYPQSVVFRKRELAVVPP